MALRQVSRLERHYSAMQLEHDAHRITTLSARGTEKLFALLAAYRLVDAIAMLRGPSYLTGVPQHRKQDYLGDKEFLLSKGWNFMQDWSQLLIDFRDATVHSAQNLPIFTGSKDYNSLRTSHLKIVGSLLTKSSALKMFLNIQLAAMHISHLFMSPTESEVSLLSNAQCRIIKIRI
jgi:hypothetical protein